MDGNNAGRNGGGNTGARTGDTCRYGFRRPEISQAGALFSITTALFIFIGYRVQKRELYSGLLITEFCLILLPAFLFMLFFRFNFKTVLRLNGTRPLNFVLTFFVMVFALPLAGLFNMLNLFLVDSILGKIIVQQLPVAKNGGELLISILIIAGSAGLCEEFLFRGVLQKAFEDFGTTRSILLTAFLFSLTHMDFQKVFGTFMLGALIGFIVYKTNSLFCGMLAHFANNGLAVLLGYLSEKIMSVLYGAGEDIPNITSMKMEDLFRGLGSLPPEQLIIALFFYGFTLCFILAVFILLIYALTRINREKRGTHAVSKPGLKGLLWLLPGLLLIAGVYYIEVHSFTGAGSPLLDLARRLLGV